MTRAKHQTAAPEHGLLLAGQLRDELLREAERQPPPAGLRKGAARRRRRKIAKLVDIERIVLALLLTLA